MSKADKEKVMGGFKVVLCTMLSVLAVVGGMARASNEIRIDITTRSVTGLCSQTTTTSYVDAGAAITIATAYCTQYIDVWAVDSTSNIGPITITGSDPPDLWLFIGAGSFPTGGGTMAPGTISVQTAEALEGQVIVNAGNSSGTWSGSVALEGPDLLNPPYYSNTSSSLGGGAIGLAPFHLHNENCSRRTGRPTVSKRRRQWC